MARVREIQKAPAGKLGWIVRFFFLVQTMSPIHDANAHILVCSAVLWSNMEIAFSLKLLFTAVVCRQRVAGIEFLKGGVQR